MAKAKRHIEKSFEELGTIDYSLTEHVELTILSQLPKGVRFHAFYAPDWKQAVKYSMVEGKTQPKKVYSWKNLCYVEIEGGW